jgi:hypothetical protein
MFHSAQKRFFEYRKGTTERYWSIWRDGEYGTEGDDSHYTVYMERGRLGQKGQEPKFKEFNGEGAHFLSEQFMDAQVMKWLRTGYNEVALLSAPTPAIEGRAMTLQAIGDGDDLPAHSVNEFEMFMIVNWLIDTGVLDNSKGPLGLEKWMARTLRKMGYRKPRLDSISEFYEDYEEILAEVDENGQFDEYWAKYLQLSERDRRNSPLISQDLIPAYKYTDANYWIVTAEECHLIVNCCEKNIKVPDAKTNKKKLTIYEMTRNWLDFHLKIIELKGDGKTQGYEIRPWEHIIDTKDGDDDSSSESSSDDSSSDE